MNFSGKLFHFVHYGVRRDTERIDMEEVRLWHSSKPKIIAGFTAYSRHPDFALRAIADEVGAYLMTDMAHFAGPPPSSTPTRPHPTSSRPRRIRRSAARQRHDPLQNG